MPYRRCRVWGMLVALLVCRAVAAETYVVAVGVEKYEDERIAPLRYAIADARAVAAAFRAAGVSQRSVTLLTTDVSSPGRQPSRIKLLTALESVKARATAADRVVFFFAGHGLEQDGQQYLLTADTRLSLLSATALPMALVAATVARPRRRIPVWRGNVRLGGAVANPGVGPCAGCCRCCWSSVRCVPGRPTCCPPASRSTTTSVSPR